MFHCVECGLRDEFCGELNDRSLCEKCESEQVSIEDELFDFTGDYNAEGSEMVPIFKW